MKIFLRKLIILLIIQTILILFLPGLSKSPEDKLYLAILSTCFSGLFYIGTHRIVKGLGVSQSRFNALFFGMMGLRMLTALILIVIYLLISNVINKAGIIFLICNYFVYIGFEIKFILPKLRTDSEKPKNTDDARK